MAVTGPRDGAGSGARRGNQPELYGFSRALISLDTLEDIAREALASCIRLTGAAAGSVWVRTAGHGIFQCVEVEGSERLPLKCAALNPAWERALQEDPGLRVVSPPEDPSPNGSHEQDPGPLPGWIRDLDADLLLPIAGPSHLLGLLTLVTDGSTRTARPADGLEEVARLTGLAIQRVGSRVPEFSEGGSDAAKVYRSRYPQFQQMQGNSPAVVDLYRNLLAVAQANCTVLLIGETGSGKEMTARVLHELSPRAEGPFVEVDCGAIPENLIESELFGHVKGAFTGASSDRRGVFELAHQGTLFLDEVANLPLITQNRLLRVLQERRFRPIGGERSLEVDVRVVAASNRDLHRAVEEGSFREDLFYRLYVYPIRIPPLRDRREDIPVLAAHFLERCAHENGLRVPRMGEDFLARLKAYDFPGNIRELRHLVERSLLGSTGRGVIVAEVLEGALDYRPTTTSATPGADAVSKRAGTLGFTTYPSRPGLERGMWVMDVLRDHRFNVKASAETLTELARKDPEAQPPLTDRSSLTYYFQVECFRLLLECSGDLEEASRVIAGDAIGAQRTVLRRLTGYVHSARMVMEGCRDRETAREVLRAKFIKLPEDYLNVLERLADHLWEQRVEAGE